MTCLKVETSFIIIANGQLVVGEGVVSCLLTLVSIAVVGLVLDLTFWTGNLSEYQYLAWDCSRLRVNCSELCFVCFSVQYQYLTLSHGLVWVMVLCVPRVSPGWMLGVTGHITRGYHIRVSASDFWPLSSFDFLWGSYVGSLLSLTYRDQHGCQKSANCFRQFADFWQPCWSL